MRRFMNFLSVSSGERGAVLVLWFGLGYCVGRSLRYSLPIQMFFLITQFSFGRPKQEKMTTRKSNITTRSMNTPHASGPLAKHQISGILDSNTREFFLGDYSDLNRKPSIISGYYDSIAEMFYPESPTLDPVAKVKYNMRKNFASNPPSLPHDSSTKSNSSQSPQQNSSLANAIQSKICRFEATHLLVGRLKGLSKNDLSITDLDLLTSTLGLKILKRGILCSI